MTKNNFLKMDLKEKVFFLWKNFPIEIVLLLISLGLISISLFIFFKTKNQSQTITFEKKEELPLSSKIYVEIAGAVKKPGVYEINEGARLKDIISLAGGLTEEADKLFFSRNFNLAEFVFDQEKIYIPAKWEIEQGLFTDQPSLIIQKTSISQNQQSTTLKININTASMEELESLPGVGKVTAQKIIDNRPYSLVEDLINKKVVGKSVFEKIKDLVTVE